MEPAVLRPRPMPGAPAGTRSGPGPVRPAATEGPPSGRSRARRAATALLAAAAGLVLLLSGVGLGVLGAALAGPGWPAGAVAASAPAAARLGVEVTDAGGPGALVVGVHVPGPGFAAGLREGDLLLAFGATRVDSAADLARAVAGTRPGTEVRLTVRHRTGGYERLTAVPGILT
ncbi:PDZ domain-containing protein [Streptomyces sp. NPDC093991]|uniref:PDZ domain-containing protein n=2 Tax=Streptomyces TaxID=1883 RepID=UPI00341D402F